MADPIDNTQDEADGYFDEEPAFVGGDAGGLPSAGSLVQFENRLLRMHKHLSKWARRQAVTCYRVYDRDIPQFPLIIDVYEHALHVAEFLRTDRRTPEERQAWLDLCLGVVSRSLGTAPGNVFVKTRARIKGGRARGPEDASREREQTRADRRPYRFVVREGGLRFLVNLRDYLDTGLFLDHRQTRALVRAEAQGKRVLNLFGYTGSFSVYAAAGGAASTLTLDLSRNYLAWARTNLGLNGFDSGRHRLERVDALRWLRESRATFDLIILDPPTFSNSKAMRETLEIQRDQTELLALAFDRLSPGGVLYFSTNFRRFALSEETMTYLRNVGAAKVENITARTIPNDFRDKKAHHCYRITNAG